MLQMSEENLRDAQSPFPEVFFKIALLSCDIQLNDCPV